MKTSSCKQQIPFVLSPILMQLVCPSLGQPLFVNTVASPTLTLKVLPPLILTNPMDHPLISSGPRVWTVVSPPSTLRTVRASRTLNALPTFWLGTLGTLGTPRLHHPTRATVPSLPKLKQLNLQSRYLISRRANISYSLLRPWGSRPWARSSLLPLPCYARPF